MILIIDNYDSFTYNLYQSIAAIYSDVTVYRNDKITRKEIELMALKAIIISPGPGRPEDAGIGIRLVQTVGKNIPILGICLGHQIIAMAHGAKVVLAQTPVHGKSVSIFHSGQGIYEGMPLPFQAGRYHSLTVEKESLPPELINESESDQGMLMGIRHASFPVYGVQFHPESILTPQGGQLIRNFLKIVNRC